MIVCQHNVTMILVTHDDAYPKKIARHAAHYTVSGPNPEAAEQWLMIHISELVKIITWNTNILTTIIIEMNKLKLQSSIYFINIIWRIDLEPDMTIEPCSAQLFTHTRDLSEVKETMIYISNLNDGFDKPPSKLRNERAPNPVSPFFSCLRYHGSLVWVDTTMQMFGAINSKFIDLSHAQCWLSLLIG